jgi:hypothetical protein
MRVMPHLFAAQSRNGAITKDHSVEPAWWPGRILPDEIILPTAQCGSIALASRVWHRPIFFWQTLQSVITCLVLMGQMITETVDMVKSSKLAVIRRWSARIGGFNGNGGEDNIGVVVVVTLIWSSLPDILNLTSVQRRSSCAKVDGICID